jgi:hypothetical protein
MFLLRSARAGHRVKKRPKIELQPQRKGSEAKESSGLRAAQAAREARKGKPSEHDAPPLRTFAGTQPPPIPGQMTLGES